MTGATRGRLQIGDVAERTGLSLRTIRHYEQVGLLPPSERSAGGFRLYTDDAVERLLVIKRMKPLEFSLEEMRDLLAVLDGLAQTGGDPVAREVMLDRLVMYREVVDERIRALRDQLETAEAFAKGLRQEITRQRRMVEPGR